MTGTNEKRPHEGKHRSRLRICRYHQGLEIRNWCKSVPPDTGFIELWRCVNGERELMWKMETPGRVSGHGQISDLLSF